ncbi:unnamed protein product [Pseudo-nitzschia multistriata]|uniref:DUF6824 domain-containing protein n=1 Tax=Pseudo-nitzschia multistriata TaxID=183589 RepID=A0A448ZI94_9STRA|nr:unnamed protein product [Pseudo-nitzschia multistriata]
MSAVDEVHENETDEDKKPSGLDEALPMEVDDQDFFDQKSSSATAANSAMKPESCVSAQSSSDEDQSNNESPIDSIHTDWSESDYLDAFQRKLSRGALGLTHSDRNSIIEEIHGVNTHIQEESPDLIRSSLLSLSTELRALVQDNAANGNTNSKEPSLSTAYILSQCIGSSSKRTYVNTPEFQLRFLRCDNFDARAAAIRMMKWLNLVHEVYGAYALYRPIQITDFTRRERKILQSGWLQVLPFRDRSGRRALIWLGEMGFNYDPVVRMKVLLFVLLAGTRDAETQRKGIVYLIWPFKTPRESVDTDNDRDYDMLSYARLAKIFVEATPTKCCAVHCCITSGNESMRSPWLISLYKLMFTLFENSMPVFNARVRFHVGTVQDSLEQLSGYGIPSGVIPITTTGTVKTVYLKQWLKLQRRIDDPLDEANELKFIDCPLSTDVLFRSGSTMLHNPGNVMFRGLIEAKIQELFGSNQLEDSHSSFSPPISTTKTKEDIAIGIVEEVVRDKNGRFLVWNSKDDCWKVLRDASAVTTKVATAYRDLKLKVAKVKDQQEQQQQQQQQQL